MIVVQAVTYSPAGLARGCLTVDRVQDSETAKQKKRIAGSVERASQTSYAQRCLIPFLVVCMAPGIYLVRDDG